MREITMVIAEAAILAYIIYNLLRQFYLANFKSDIYNANKTLVFSIISTIVGFFVWLINGLNLDYGTIEEKEIFYSDIFWFLGISIMVIGLFLFFALIIIRLFKWLKNKI